MREKSRLKPANPWIILPLIAVLAVAVVLIERYDNDIFQVLMMTVMALAAASHMVILLRTGNPVYLVPTSFYLLAAAVAFSILEGWRNLIPWLAGGAGVMFLFFIATLATKRIKWYYSDILELAARPVQTFEDGFSERPFPAGKADYTREEIEGFAGLLGRKAVAVPRFEEDRVVLVIPENVLGFFLFPARSHDGSTYLSFGFDGAVTVNIARKDYSRYRDELTFDQLCSSLGSMFKELLSRYQAGDIEAIFSMLDASAREKDRNEV